MAQFNEDAYRILGISRPISFEVEQTDNRDQTKLSFAKYSNLHTDEQKLCVLYANGFTTKEIASTLGVSPKTVENRRNKIVTELGLGRAFDLIKLMVRFEERNLISESGS